MGDLSGTLPLPTQATAIHSKFPDADAWIAGSPWIAPLCRRSSQLMGRPVRGYVAEVSRRDLDVGAFQMAEGHALRIAGACDRWPPHLWRDMAKGLGSLEGCSAASRRLLLG